MAIGSVLSPLTIAQIAVNPAPATKDCVECKTQSVQAALATPVPAMNEWGKLMQAAQKPLATAAPASESKKPAIAPISVPQFKDLDFSYIPQSYADLRKFSEYHQQLFEFRYAPVLPVIQPLFPQNSGWLTSAYYNGWFGR